MREHVILKLKAMLESSSSSNSNIKYVELLRDLFLGLNAFDISNQRYGINQSLIISLKHHIDELSYEAKSHYLSILGDYLNNPYEIGSVKVNASLSLATFMNKLKDTKASGSTAQEPTPKSHLKPSKPTELKLLDKYDVLQRIIKGETIAHIAMTADVAETYVQMLYDKASKEQNIKKMKNQWLQPDDHSRVRPDQNARKIPLVDLAKLAKGLIEGLHPSDIAGKHNMPFDLIANLNRIIKAIVRPIDKSKWIVYLDEFIKAPFDVPLYKAGIYKLAAQAPSKKHYLTALFGRLRFGKPLVSLKPIPIEISEDDD